ncbi:hypothetical protein ACFWIX_05660 [Pseudarthrobacter sp. NPDC058362]|uniref:hypothetical protein n=1 Tax=Pseudarthrobacter sp. NPDC058362 TaxID=3346458 RepID=UPI003647A991
MARRIRGDATAAAVMTAGSATFLAGAFMPISKVYVEGDPRRKLAILLADPVQWKAQQLLLAGGTAVMPVGVVLLARNWRAGNEEGSEELIRGQRLSRGAAVLLVAGAGLFLGHLKERYRDPAAFALGHQPAWPFLGYMWLSLAGMAALGGGLLVRATAPAVALPRVPRWPGRLNVGGAAVLGTVLAATGDLPPLLVYGIELATGVALIRHLRRKTPPELIAEHSTTWT